MSTLFISDKPPASANSRRSGQLCSVLYVSTAVREMSDLDLCELLQQSTSNNSLNEITGMLVYAGTSFMQVLEGPALPLDAMMIRILEDPRHTNVEILWRREIVLRDFPNWSMAFRTFDREVHRDLKAFTPFVDADNLDVALRSDARRSYDLMRAFKEARFERREGDGERYG